MTPTPGAPEDLSERPLCKADIEGILVMDGSGAYRTSQACRPKTAIPPGSPGSVGGSGG